MNDQSPATVSPLSADEALAKMRALTEGADAAPQPVADPEPVTDEGEEGEGEEGEAEGEEGEAEAAAPEPAAEPAQPVKSRRKAKPRGPVMVKFLSKDRGLKVLLGEGRDVQFDEGVALVTQEVADILCRHHLYNYDHIQRADETVVIHGKLVSFKGDPGFRAQLDAIAESGDVLFYLDAPRNTPINLGDQLVRFDNGRAVVSKAIAARMRRHRFFIEGRLAEITAT